MHEAQIWPCKKKVNVYLWSSLVDLESMMLYNKIQPQSFLDIGEEGFRVFTIYGHGRYLAQWRRTTWTIWQYPFDRRPHVKSDEISEKTFKIYTILYMYISQW